MSITMPFRIEVYPSEVRRDPLARHGIPFLFFGMVKCPPATMKSAPVMDPALRFVHGHCLALARLFLAGWLEIDPGHI